MTADPLERIITALQAHGCWPKRRVSDAFTRIVKVKGQIGGLLNGLRANKSLWVAPQNV